MKMRGKKKKKKREELSKFLGRFGFLPRVPMDFAAF